MFDTGFWSRWRVAAPLITTLVMLDQLTKQLMERTLVVGEEVVLTPFLSLTLSYNPGAAFGILSSAGGWQRPVLSLFAIAVIGWLLVWIHRLSATEHGLLWGLAAIAGGAMGNLIDRVLSGEVTDFISLHYQHFYWPTFNLADAAITLGVVSLLFASLRGESRS